MIYKKDLAFPFDKLPLFITKAIFIILFPFSPLFSGWWWKETREAYREMLDCIKATKNENP